MIIGQLYRQATNLPEELVFPNLKLEIFDCNKNKCVFIFEYLNIFIYINKKT